MAKTAEPHDAELRFPLNLERKALPPPTRARCSACQGQIMLDGRGEVLFCADCMKRAHDDPEWSELGGGD